MKLPAYLQALGLPRLPLDYEWDWEELIPFREAPDDDSPALAEAVQGLSPRAAFALCVACYEWVVARVDGHTAIDEALQRSEAAWAAVVAPGYASLPCPKSRTLPPQEFVRPLDLASIMLSDAYEGFTEDVDELYCMAIGFPMLASHVCGSHPAFAPWLAKVLERCKEHFPTFEGTPTEEKPLPGDFFDPAFSWDEAAAQQTVDLFVQSLTPDTNPYLRSLDQSD